MCLFFFRSHADLNLSHWLLYLTLSQHLERQGKMSCASVFECNVFEVQELQPIASSGLLDTTHSTPEPTSRPLWSLIVAFPLGGTPLGFSFNIRFEVPTFVVAMQRIQHCTQQWLQQTELWVQTHTSNAMSRYLGTKTFKPNHKNLQYFLRLLCMCSCCVKL